MSEYRGECQGGPYDGRMQACRAKVIPVFARKDCFVLHVSGEAPSMEIGAYFWKDGVWEWQTK